MTDAGGNRTVFRPSPLRALKTPAAPPPPPEPAAQPSTTPPIPAAPHVLPTPAGATANPMLAGALPILALVAGMRAGRVRMPLAQLHRQVTQLVAAFDPALRAAYPENVARRALYAVCATVDDVAEHLPGLGGDGAEWAKRSLVGQIFQARIGGDRFWQLVDDALRAPDDQRALIELYHACLAAGFEDRFRGPPDGRQQVQEVMRTLYAALPTRDPTDLSPHWRGEQMPVARVGAPTRVAVVAAVAAVLLLLVYVALRVLLVGSAAAPAAAVASIIPEGPLRLSRGGASVAPPPPSAAILRLRSALAADIAQGRLAVEDDATTTRVRTTAGPLFVAGSDTPIPGAADLFTRIGAAIGPLHGVVVVEDHVGGGGASLAFPDAGALSSARADRVAAVVKKAIGDPARVVAKGMGATVPIAATSTPEGSARNDRVEIVLPRPA